MIKHKEHEVITPEPYFKINFGCSNRAFYGVKSDLYNLAESIDIEIEDGYITEKCDYEGDLEEIVIYACDRADSLINAVLNMYGIDKSELPLGQNVHLSIY